MLRRGIGINIGVLRSATIVYESDFIRLWFGDGPKSANNSRFRLCYNIIAFANLFANLFLYLIAELACGGGFVVASFRFL